MSEVISDETSKRICAHMNEDHAASVHGMVLSCINRKGEGISDAKMVSLSMEGCELKYVACHGDMCEMKNAFMKFDPPLKSVKESRPRLIAIHHAVLTPKIHWLFTDPLSVFLIAITSLLGYGACGFGGHEGLVEALQGAKRLNETIVSIWGSTEMLASQVFFFWYFAFIVHIMEASYVAYHAIRTMKLKLRSTFLWFYLVSCVGYPVAKRFLEFLKVHTEAAKSSGGKKKH